MPPDASAARPGSPPPNLATPHYPLLDSLRGIAVLSVFIAHVQLYLINTHAVGPLLSRLDGGVAVFLLLSAFLLYRPFAQARFDGTVAPAVVSFGVRRFVRIVPAYWISLPLVALLLSQDYVFTPEGILTYFGFLQIYHVDTIQNGIGQAWTVCVEVSFYVMLPIWAWAVRKLPRRSTRDFLLTEFGTLAAIFVFSVVWKIIAFKTGPWQSGIGAVQVHPWLFTLPAYLDAFAVGMALAVASVVLTGRDRQPGVVRLIQRAPWLAIIAAGVAWWLSGIGGGTTYVESRGAYVLHQQFNTLFAVALFLPAIFGDLRRGWLRRLLHNRALVWLATVSYGFYLWHLVVMRKVWELGPAVRSPVVFIIVTFAITSLIAAAIWYTVGRWGIRLGQRLPRGRPAPSQRKPDPASAPRPEPVPEASATRGRP